MRKASALTQLSSRWGVKNFYGDDNLFYLTTVFWNISIVLFHSFDLLIHKKQFFFTKNIFLKSKTCGREPLKSYPPKKKKIKCAEDILEAGGPATVILQELASIWISVWSVAWYDLFSAFLLSTCNLDDHQIDSFSKKIHFSLRSFVFRSCFFYYCLFWLLFYRVCLD